MKLILVVAASFLFVVACIADEQIADDRFAVSDLPVRYLSQNWSSQESLEFYGLRQGSPIMRKAFFDALEQPGSEQLFHDSSYLASFGFLPQSQHAGNPDGYPIGFVANDAIELNCSACHTSQFRFDGNEYRVDGGQANTDLESWLAALVLALRETIADAPTLEHLRTLPPSRRMELDPATKFGRFTQRLVRTWEPRVSQLYPIVYLLNQDYQRRQRYNDYNDFGQAVLTQADREAIAGHLAYGFSRLDALGAILNQACAEDLNISSNASAADGPVNYPAIWDAPQHARVQWNGAVDNRKAFGPLGRNAGQVVGVFGLVEIDGDAWIGYDTSIRFGDLERAEELVTKLWSPRWAEVFDVDGDLAQQGRLVYQQHCRDCHAVMKRDDPRRDPQDVLIPVSQSWRGYPPLDTDPRAAQNWLDRRAKVGPLAGRYQGKPFGSTFPDRPGALVPSRDILSHLIANAIVRSYIPWREELTLQDADAADVVFATTDQSVAEYKARPLNGAWATAPFLHNGSVLNMAELLKPPGDRLTKFRTGSVEFDPETIGFKNEGPFEFDTSIDGNLKTGHVYGTSLPPAEKRALLEYLKTL